MNETLPANMAAYLCHGGPVDGELVVIAKGEQEFRWRIPEDDLEVLLAASVRVQQGELVALPEKVAIYRLVCYPGDGKVVPLERMGLEFTEWE